MRPSSGIYAGAHTDTFTSRPTVFILILKTLCSELASDTQMRVLDEHLIRIAAVVLLIVLRYYFVVRISCYV